MCRVNTTDDAVRTHVVGVEVFVRVFQFVERRLQSDDHVVEHVREERQAEGDRRCHSFTSCRRQLGIPMRHSPR